MNTNHGQYYYNYFNIVVVFCTRPVATRQAPILAALKRHRAFRPVALFTGQHTDLVAPFVRHFGIRIDHQLRVFEPDQHLNRLFARILYGCDGVLANGRGDTVVVQGDTKTAAATALAAFQRKIPIAHVDAGPRTGDVQSPFPEELKRRLIAAMTRWYFAATGQQASNLRGEGVADWDVFLTGNPVVDALHGILTCTERSRRLIAMLDTTAGTKRITLTTHSRESFDGTLVANLRVVRRFVECHPDNSVIFPVQPNPQVRLAAESVLTGPSGVHLTVPLNYPDFLGLLSYWWVIESDSDGVQEEAPGLGVPLLILQEYTERPEVIDTGLATDYPTDEDLPRALDHRYRTPRLYTPTANPFGEGRPAERIVSTLHASFDQSARAPEVAA